MFKRIWILKNQKTMNNVNTDFQAGRQIVVFDQIDATYPGGVHISKTDSALRFTDGVIPAGTLVIKGANGLFSVVNEELDADNVSDAIGLTHFAVKIDDFPLVAVVMAGTARIDALPEFENEGVDFIKTVLPRISFI